jgi:hypothetical protein
MGPCGRDRQVLFDYHPTIRVLLPTGQGLRSVLAADLLPYGGAWTLDGGTQPYDPDRRHAQGSSGIPVNDILTG